MSRALVLIALMLVPCTARAQETATGTLASSSTVTATADLPPESAPPGEKRPVPSYDGRDSPPPDTGEVLIWIPRTVLLPVHLTLEYLIRIPLVAAIEVIEKHHVVERVAGLFTFRGGRAALFPTGLVELGFAPSVGLYGFYDDLFVRGDTTSLQAAAWANGSGMVALRSRVPVLRDHSAETHFRVELATRPDEVFYGLGPATREIDQTHFRWRRIEAELGLDGLIGTLDRAGVFISFRDGAISSGVEPTFAHDEQYRLLGVGARLAADTRPKDRPFTPGSGVRLDLTGGFRVDPSSADTSFGFGDAELAGFLDLTGLNHVIGLSLYAAMLEPLGGGAIPFTELLTFGGGEHMRGFLRGRFRGQSASEATVQYRWPIWTYLDASLFTSLGNVFGPRFEGFAVDRSFLSGGIGLRTNTSRESSFDIVLALGSNRLDSESLIVDHVRFMVGLNHGF